MFAPVPADAGGQRPVSPDTSVSIAAETPEPVDVEARRVSNMICDVKPKEDGAGYQVVFGFGWTLTRLTWNLLFYFLIDDFTTANGRQNESSVIEYNSKK